MDKQLLVDANEAKKQVRHLNLTLAPLEADMQFAADELQKAPGNQFWRRTVIRCLLAATEALLWNLKHTVPYVARVSSVEITPKELEIINEQRIVIKDGKTEYRLHRLKFRDNIKATFTLFAKVHGASLSWKDNSEFDAFCATYELRNRLMHPKRPNDPAVSDLDIKAAQSGVRWFVQEYTQLMKECGEAIPKLASVQRRNK